MIKINNHLRVTEPNKIPTDLYMVDKDSTMGRLIRKMLDKGEYGHQHFEGLTYIERLQVEEQRLDVMILDQVRELERWNRVPRKVLVGGRTFEEFHSFIYETHAMWECKVGQVIKDRTAPEGYRREIWIMGLPVTIVPTMDGVLVLDDLMLEVPARPPRP